MQRGLCPLSRKFLYFLYQNGEFYAFPEIFILSLFVCTDFKRGATFEAGRLMNVNVYQLMCHVMQLEAAPHNGTWSNVCDSLVDPGACHRGPYPGVVSLSASLWRQDAGGRFLVITVALATVSLLRPREGCVVGLLRWVCLTVASRSQRVSLIVIPFCLSVGYSATYSLPRLIDHNQIWTRVSLFGSPTSHTFDARGKNMQNFAYFQRQPFNAYSCHCERDASCHMTCLFVCLSARISRNHTAKLQQILCM